MPRSLLATIPKTVWILGAAMCLINISVVIVFSLCSLFLKTTLKVSPLWIGFLEGGVEGLSFLMKLVSGIYSDYLKNRKRLMLIGYALTVASKPLIAISTGFYSVSLSRMLERLGNGIQSTPRDALIGDVAPAHLRGTCYGFQRGLGTFGSLIGSLVAFLAMFHFQNHFQSVFWVASIPAFAAFLLLVVFVKEPKHEHTEADIVVNKRERHPIHMSDLSRLGSTYWLLMIVVAVFWIARVSEGLLVSDSMENLGLPLYVGPLFNLTYNFTYCIASFVCGFYSDRIGRYGLLTWTIIALMVADVILFTGLEMSSVWLTFTGMLFWGVQLGMSMNLFTGMIADLAPSDLRGTAFGCYYLISAISTIAAGYINGWLTLTNGIASAFELSLVLAGLALIAQLFFLPKPKKVVP